MKKIGKFEVVDLLGRGAMGMVYKGWDPSLNRHVAIKVMTAHLDMDPELRARFFREAQAAGSLQHPNIITVFELGQSDGQPYIAMEFVPGRDLDEIIESREPLTIVEKVDLVEQVCRGLAYAHDRQIVHRDIKPANIRVTESGQVKLMDFGVAHLMTSELTQTGSLIGTPFYMAPEVINGEPVDARADIFSLGATFYELLAYTRPFQGDNMQTIFRKILHVDPPPLRQLGLDVPPLVQKVLNRCLAKRPSDRYGNMGELLTDLMQFWESVPGGPQARTAATTALGEAVTRAARAARRKARLRRMIPAAIGAAGAAALIVIVGSALLRGDLVGPPTQEASDPTAPSEMSREPSGTSQGQGADAGAAEEATDLAREDDATAGRPAPPPEEPASTEPQPTGRIAESGEPETAGADRAEAPDPALDDYETARGRAARARQRAVEANASRLAADAFRQGESLRQNALGAAAAGRYAEAAQEMESARTSYESAAQAAEVWRARLDSAWSVVSAVSARANEDAPQYDRAEERRREAERAESEGRPEIALAHLASAADLYREARAAPPAEPPEADSQPSEPERAEPEPAETAPEPAPREIVDATLTDLRRAIESEDLGRLRRIWVGLTPSEVNGFEALFQRTRDLQVEFEVLDLTRAGDRIDVTVRTTYDYWNTSTRRPRHDTFDLRLEIGRQDDRWVVLRSRG